MAETADKIKQTQNSFPAQTAGAVASCPLAARPPVSETKPAPVQQQPVKVLAKPAPTVEPASKTEEPKKKAWIEILLVDADGKPMPGVKYRITPPGGAVPREGVLNQNGQAGYYDFEPGNCKITFPDLDKDAWE